MVWPDTYGEEDIEITYNTSDRASWMRMADILHEFLQRSYFARRIPLRLGEVKVQRL